MAFAVLKTRRNICITLFLFVALYGRKYCRPELRRMFFLYVHLMYMGRLHENSISCPLSSQNSPISNAILRSVEDLI